MIIFAGIIARFPDDIIKTYWLGTRRIYFIGICAGYFVSCCRYFRMYCFLGKRTSAKFRFNILAVLWVQRVYGGQSTYIPFKINPAGVMPVIFSNAVLNVPLFLLRYLSDRIEFLKQFAVSFSLWWSYI